MTSGTGDRPEAAELEGRRAAFNRQADASQQVAAHAPAWGLALSGGGIRSATFCFGLLRGLATSRGLLGHFDYLSTVSGGGYLGAAYGRLFSDQVGPREVEQGLRDDRSLLLTWLRLNSRYLAPAGASDLLRATATIVRGAVASMLEAGVLFVLAGLVVVLPRLLAQWCREQGCGLRLPQLASTWFWLIAVAGLWAAGAIAWYWLYRPGTGPGARSLPEARLRATQQLAWALLMGATCLGVGCMDWLAGQLAASLMTQHPVRAGLAALLPGLGLALVLRPLVPLLTRFVGQPAASTGGQTRLRRAPKLSTLINLLGLLVWVAVALGWLVLLLVVFQSGARKTAPDGPALWSGLFLLLVLYTVLTRQHTEALNLSSMHHLYRARLERAFVSTGNVGPDGRFRVPPVEPGSLSETRRADEALPNDDVTVPAYRPQDAGGPIHLMTCCINQTVDDRTGTYNADRKGMALTVSSLGVELGTRRAQPWPQQAGAPAWLSRWVSVSGAAAGSGMGSLTTPGLAALMFLSGLRLGYWTPPLVALGDGQRPREGALPWTERLGRALPKTACVVAEMFARFPGLGSHSWYVSDGGHFENTAVYALLKRKPGVVLVADCGADPLRSGEDFENLMRKSLIDYRVRIVPLDPQALQDGGAPAAAAGLLAQAGTLQEVFAPGSRKAVLVAAIREDSDLEAPYRGLLVLVKPTLVDGLAMDITGYAARNPPFPQQSTGDQFFDEEQWEAYHQLGRHLGQLLTLEALQQLQAQVSTLPLR